MRTFLIVADPSDGPSISAALLPFGGRNFTASSWIADWQGNAHMLCEHLRPHSSQRLVVCCLDDWSYR